MPIALFFVFVSPHHRVIFSICKATCYPRNFSNLLFFKINQDKPKHCSTWSKTLQSFPGSPGTVKHPPPTIHPATFVFFESLICECTLPWVFEHALLSTSNTPPVSLPPNSSHAFFSLQPKGYILIDTFPACSPTFLILRELLESPRCLLSWNFMCACVVFPYETVTA